MRDFSSFSYKHTLLPPACIKPLVTDSPNENTLPYYLDHYSHLHDDCGSVIFKANSRILNVCRGKEQEEIWKRWKKGRGGSFIAVFQID